jgi:alpha-L-fucosidase 2
MVFGGVENERLQLNEESVWTGEPRWDANPEALKALPEVRKLLFNGKYREAEKLAQERIMGTIRRDEKSSYQTLGDLILDFGANRGVSGYRRELDIEEAMARVSYTVNQVKYSREIFSSFPSQVLVIRLTADRPGALTFTARLSRPGNKASIIVRDNEIRMSEHIGNGMGVRIESRLRAMAESGTLISGGDSIRIEKADAVSIFLAAATDYSGDDPEPICANRLDSAIRSSYSDIREAHIADYQSFFKRVTIELGESDGNYFSTDARITAIQNGYTDTDLIELYYQFGRYLLITSRPETFRPTFRGSGRWTVATLSADYHININIQMNYPSETKPR